MNDKGLPARKERQAGCLGTDVEPLRAFGVGILRVDVDFLPPGWNKWAGGIVHTARSGEMGEKGERYRNRIEILQGTLDLLTLQTLQWGPQHGYGISVAIRNRSGELL